MFWYGFNVDKSNLPLRKRAIQSHTITPNPNNFVKYYQLNFSINKIEVLNKLKSIWSSTFKIWWPLRFVYHFLTPTTIHLIRINNH